MKRYLAVMGMGFLLGFRHRGIDDDAGIESEIVKAIRHKNTPKISRRDESAVCNFSQTILTEREVDDDTYQAALDVLGKAGLVELVGFIGSYSSTSMTLNTFKIPVRSGMMRPYPDIRLGRSRLPRTMHQEVSINGYGMVTCRHNLLYIQIDIIFLLLLRRWVCG